MPEDGKELLRRFYGEVNAGNLDAIDVFIADDFVEHEEFPGISNDKAGVRQFFTMFRAAFPDMRMDPHEMLADGDLVSTRATFTGTHQGAFMGMPPTHKRVEATVFDMVRLRDGQAVEHWGLFDAMALMQQLGAMPSETPA